MTGDKDFLVNIRPMQCGEVTFGNGLAENVIGMGTLNFEGLPRLKDVMLVEGLRANLLSISQICDQGYTVNFDSNRCYVVNDQDEIILQGFRSNDNCYTLTTYATCHSAIDNSTDLCHKKLGHIHFKNLKKLSNVGIVRGLPKLVLELLHMDLMGPIQVESLNGISHEFSAPKTPQQNGVVERKNQTLTEMARLMLNSKKLTKHLWAEAINTACYTINRVFLRPGTHKTPYEIWKCKKPNVSHFHVFGSACYILRDRDHIGKFDAKSDVGVFIGYSINSRAYRVYNMRTQTVMKSANVVVDDLKDFSEFSTEE
ncbi:uncharacterized protein LOC133785489 [Humulus lupulus]|uniref:uncharacterized protein LOC133785489 n=1 Tax=Humulus lupulus TaxID=3486 RepID=UPI002B40468E|nr:uncharacterized protein LOC133785489 [Humulus lupulus]